jgi:lipopolysaccharide export system protein LptA
VTGQAGKGLKYFMKQKVLILFQAKGVWSRAGIPYDFQTSFFWVMEKQKVLILKEDSSVVGNGASLRGDRISLQFDQDFANLESASAFGHCYFKAIDTADHDRKRSKEITANMIKIMYDPQGRLQKIVAHGAGKMSMVENQNSGQIESESIEIFMNGETQALEKVRVLSRGTLVSRGKENITVSGDLLSAFYSPAGILTGSKAEKNCEFSTGDFQGTADEINYDAQHFRIDITSKDHDAAVLSKKNIFNSSRFLINTKTRQLSSSQNVKATVIPEKKNVLFRAKPLLITAAGMEMTEKGNLIRFKDKVKLFQDEIEMHTGTLLFDSRNNRISAQGNADLKFFNEKELVVLRGKTILFNAQQKNMVVEDDAQLNQAENVLTARQVKLAFGKNDLLENISAVDNISFSKKDISGKSQLLFWNYQAKTVLFKNQRQGITVKPGYQ